MPRRSVRDWIGRNSGAKAAAITLSAILVQGLSVQAVGASGVEQINGSGSSWSYNAMNTWVTDATQRGLQVVFTPSGSAQGRTDYANGVTDYAVSDIGYLGQDPVTGLNDTSNRAYAYLPIVGGATTFPYHVVVAGSQVLNIRLSGLTLAKIFTDNITNWNDPAITADNNGQALPSIPIVPVVHSEGAGTTYQFTNWLATEFPSLWKAFSGYSYPVEFWPTGQGSQVPANGSDQVMSVVTSSAGQGAIAYDEYSYALGAGYPVAAIENTAGYFTMPDAYDAAVALTQAQINHDPNPADCKSLGFNSSPCYLLENLASVYTYNDQRTYPLSSYSYEILPVASSDPTMNTAKRQALANFDTIALCQGQAQMAPIGYSPLPVNLVQASFQQVGLLNKADSGVDVSNVDVAKCNNPTFIPGQPDQNYLAKIAPYPPSCAKAGQGPCPGQYAHNGNPVNGQAAAVSTTPGLATPGGTGGTSNKRSSGGGKSTTGGSSGTGSSGVGGTSSGGTSSGGTNSGGTSSGGTSGNNSAATTTAGSRNTSASGGSNTGGGSSGSNGSSQSNSGSVSDIVPVAAATVLSADHPGVGFDLLIQVCAALLIVFALAAPALIQRARRGRRTG